VEKKRKNKKKGKQKPKKEKGYTMWIKRKKETEKTTQEKENAKNRKTETEKRMGKEGKRSAHPRRPQCMGGSRAARPQCLRHPSCFLFFFPSSVLFSFFFLVGVFFCSVLFSSLVECFLFHPLRVSLALSSSV
jgi:hypothetical protein